MHSVKQIQARPKTLGFDPGPLFGEMGPKTQAAIVAFKKALSNRRSALSITAFEGTVPIVSNTEG